MHSAALGSYESWNVFLPSSEVGMVNTSEVLKSSPAKYIPLNFTNTVKIKSAMNFTLKTSGVHLLNTTEKTWHNELIRLFFGEYLIEYYEDPSYTCSAYNVTLHGMVDGCLMHSFLNLFSCVQDISDDRKRCSCHELCLVNGSCCFDAIFARYPHPPNQNLRAFINANHTDTSMDCLPAVNADYAEYIDHLLMQTDCTNESSDPSLRAQCVASDTPHQPVFVPKLSRVFKNPYCAICSNELEFYFVNFTAKHCQPIFEGVDPQTHEDLFNCNYLVDGRNDVGLSLCKKKYDRFYQREKSGFCSELDIILCKAYLAPVGYQSYANPHCLKCLENSTQFRISIPPHIHRVVKDGYSFTMRYVESKLLVEELKLSCFSYDIKPCQQQINNKFLGTSSTPEATIMKGTPRQRFIACIFQGDGSIFVRSERSQRHRQLLKRQMTHLNLKMEELTASSYDYRNSEKVKANDSLWLEKPSENVALWGNIKEVLLFPLKNLLKTEIYGETLKHMHWGGRICHDAIEYAADTLNVTDDCRVRYKTGESAVEDIYDKRKAMFWMKIDEQSETYYLSLCTAYHQIPSCQFKNFTSDEYKTLPDGVIKLKHNGLDVTPDRYLPTEDGIAICVTSLLPTGYQLKDIQRLMSNTLGSVSILAGLVTIVAYSRFENIMTVPKKNLVCLSLSILFSDILVIVWNEIRMVFPLCKAVGVMLHFSLLSQQLWGAIIAFDFCYVFKSNAILTRESGSKELKLYNLVGWGLPASTVAVLYFIDLGLANTFMQYGTNDICWIGTQWGSIGAYVIPTAACLFFNIILFGMTFQKIHAIVQDGVDAGVRQRSANDTGKMAIKMAILLGFAEVIGFIQLPGDSYIITTTNDITSFTYSFLRSCRGLLVFICFFRHKRMWNLWKVAVGIRDTSATGRGTSDTD